MLELSTLRAAWEHVRAGGGVAGVDREDAVRFAHDLDGRLAALARAVESGSYAPLPALCVRIPKHRHGGERELAIPAVEDRVLQRAFLDTVVDLVDRRFLPCSHGYRPGGSVRSAVRAVRRAVERRSWVADCDIRDFFASVPHDRLVAELEDWIDDAGAIRLVRLWLQTPILRGSTIERSTRGLPQGAPISPLLANVFLHRLDVGLWRPDHVYVRFADDFVVCCPTEPAADAALVASREILETLGLALAEEKSRVVDVRRSSLIFLGHLVRQQGRRREAEREVPTVRTLYVTEAGATVKKREGRFVIEKKGRTLVEVPIAKVRELHVFGSAHVTTGVAVTCLERGIDVVFLSSHGRYLGRLQSWESKSPLVRQAQYEAARDPEVCLRIARGFVAGKIANQRRLLQRQMAKQDALELRPIAERMKPLPRAVEKAATMDTLRSVEGQASRCFFDALPHFLGQDFGFSGRRRRPPTDPVNSLLSFAYTLLTQEMVSAVATAGLDPFVGFLHFAKPEFRSS